MNRLILKYAYPITFAILAVLAWVVYREISVRRSELIPFIIVAVLVWGLGTLVFVYFWPRITFTAFRRAVARGLGGDPTSRQYAVLGPEARVALGAELQPTRDRNRRGALHWRLG